MTILESFESNYRSQSVDSSPVFDRMEFWLLRQRSPVERLQMALALKKRARQVSLRSLKSRFALLTVVELAHKVAQAWLQEHYAPGFTPNGDESMWIQDPLEIALMLHRLLTEMRIPYFITGGIAAVAYGEPRTTRDLDIVISLDLGQLDRVVTELEHQGFYVSGIDEVRSGKLRTLQIIHTERIDRADLMLAGMGEFDRIQFERRQVLEISEGSYLFYISPEDLVLNKLLWRRTTLSEQQWRDVLGILKVQADLLDVDYLRNWAGRLDLLGELEQVMEQAGLAG